MHHEKKKRNPLIRNLSGTENCREADIHTKWRGSDYLAGTFYSTILQVYISIYCPDGRPKSKNLQVLLCAVGRKFWVLSC